MLPACRVTSLSRHDDKEYHDSAGKIRQCMCGHWHSHIASLGDVFLWDGMRDVKFQVSIFTSPWLATQIYGLM